MDNSNNSSNSRQGPKRRLYRPRESLKENMRRENTESSPLDKVYSKEYFTKDDAKILAKSLKDDYESGFISDDDYKDANVALVSKIKVEPARSETRVVYASDRASEKEIEKKKEVPSPRVEEVRGKEHVIEEPSYFGNFVRGISNQTTLRLVGFAALSIFLLFILVRGDNVSTTDGSLLVYIVIGVIGFIMYLKNKDEGARH